MSTAADSWARDVADRVDAVLGDALYWFPVRHHSPNTARHLRDALRRRRPRVVFIEGPPDCNALVPFVVHAKTKPPVALYTSFRDDDDRLGLAGSRQPPTCPRNCRRGTRCCRTRPNTSR
jgi:hypothetical protein